jgi:AcrR family transcriptional regulator
MQRKSAILLAANSHFAHHGYRGASLRDIARDAGVSLTLLNHHFGSKFQLLSAVIEAHRKVLDDRTSSMRALMASPTGFSVADMVAAWVRLGFETAAQTDGEVFLRLVSRVIDDPEEEAVQVVRDKLDDGALIFIDALLQCHPGGSRYSAACAYMWFNASLLKFLIGSRRLLRLARSESPLGSPAPLPHPAPREIRFDPADGARGEPADLHPAAAAPMGPDGADGAEAAPASLAHLDLREGDQALLCRFLVAGIEAVMKA